jgi:hypothetical protein
MKTARLKILNFLIDKLVKTKNNIIMSEVTINQQLIYVWCKTERAGDIVFVADTQNSDGEFLHFTDGTRINSSIIDEMLIAAKDEDDAANISKTFGGLGNVEPPKTPGVKMKIPEKTTNNTTDRRITDGKSAPDPEVNVMMEMLSKMSKKNQAEMPVKVNIPSIQVYEMLKDQMDLEDSDLNEQIGLLIENQINNLQDQLRSQIQSFITNYYTNE